MAITKKQLLAAVKQIKEYVDNRKIDGTTGADLSNFYDKSETNALLKNKADKTDIPNVSEFVKNTADNLLNYYLKSETYTREEINNLIGNISGIKMEKIDVLPTENISTTIIYLLPKENIENENIYDEYININGTENGWECIGNTKIDVSNLASIEYVDNAVKDKADRSELFSGSYNDLTDIPESVNGKSAYEIAKEAGYEGTEEEWLESLKGKDGINGSNGIDGKSAYDIAKENGFEGDEETWLKSLKGETGEQGIQGEAGKDGTNGLSAYDIAKNNGFEDTEEVWLESLKGKDGENGKDGINGTDGISPTATIERNTNDNGAIITITDLNGTTSATVYDGKDGNASEASGDENKIEIIKVNGNDLIIDENKAVNIEIHGHNNKEVLDTITNENIESWNNKANSSDVLLKTDISEWAKAENKPSYNASEVNADEVGAANNALTQAKEYTDTQISNLINGAPETLDTLNEIAVAIKDNEEVVDILDSAISNKAEQTDLDLHINNSNIHITEEEKERIQNIVDGKDGIDGKSAYEIAKETGYEGTEEEWLESLKGKDGETGNDGVSPIIIISENTDEIYTLNVTDINGTITTPNLIGKQGPQGEIGPQGIQGEQGINGKSAYELAKDNNFEGTEEEWLESLKGKDGINGEQGADGLSAYQIAINNGFEGDEEAWLASLKGETGKYGENGTDGVSPTITVERNANDNGAIITAIDINGTTTVSVYDGKDGNASEASGEDNIIEIIKVNNVDLAIDANKAVNIEIHEHNNKEILDTITSENIESWNNKSDFDGSYNSLTNIPESLPASDVYDWAKTENKPTYTYDEVGADQSGSADSALTSAKEYTDTKIADLLNNSSEDIDSIYELRDAMQENKDVIESLNSIASSKVSSEELNTHINSNIHITTDERTKWNKNEENKIDTIIVNGIEKVPDNKVVNITIHEHDNKEILDTITNETIENWNNKSDFDGSYNSLTDTPDVLLKSDVSEWAKAETKPTYTAEEVGANVVANEALTLSKEYTNTEITSHTNNLIHITSEERNNIEIAKTHSESQHAPVDSEKNTIISISKNGEVINPNDERNINIIIPTNISELTNDTGYVSTNTTYELSKNDNTITLTGSDNSTTSVNIETYEKATAENDGLMSKDDKAKLNNIEYGAEVNQNAFGNVIVGNNTITAKNQTDSLTLEAGNNVSLNSENNIITISANDTTYKTGDEETLGLTKLYNGIGVNTDGSITQSAITSELNNKVSTSRMINGKDLSTDVTLTYSDVNADESGSAEKALTDAKNYTDTSINNVNDNINEHINNIENPHNVTKTQIGLSNVEDKSSEMIRNEITEENVTTALGYKPYTPNEIDNKLSALENNIDWKEAVETYDDIATTYPEPQDGWTVNVKDIDYTYRYNGVEWIVVSTNAIPKATDSVDGLMTSDMVNKLNTISDNANNVGFNQSLTEGTHIGTINIDGVETNLYAPTNTDTTYEHPTYDVKQSGLYKITVDETGHVSETSSVIKSDITALGIPESDTTYEVVNTKNDGLMSKDDKIKLDNIADEANNVQFTQNLTEGTQIGTININGVETNIYAPNDTDTHYESKNVIGNSTDINNTNIELTNGNVYLNSVENGQVTSSHKIIGTGATSVTTDNEGNIIIDSAVINNTTYEAAGEDLGLVKTGGDVTIENGIISINEHTHSIENIENLQTELDNKVSTSLTINGKELSDNITLTNTDVNADIAGSANTALENAKSYTDEKIADLINNAPETLDTLNEIATAINENQGVVDTLNSAISNKAEQTDLESHINNNSNPHNVTKEQLGLENVENKSSTEILSELTKEDIVNLGIPSNDTTYVNATTETAGLMSAEDKEKIDSIENGANVNQNAFSNIIIGDATLSANNETDNIVLEAGNNVSLELNENKITINSTDTTYTHPTYDAKQSGLYKITVDETGHINNTIEVTKSDIVNLGIPSENTDTHYESKNIVGNFDSIEDTNIELTNGNVYLNSIENNEITSSHNITGTGATTVTTNSEGNIIINSNNTTYEAAGEDLGLVKTGGDVTIENGIISINEHTHSIENIENLQTELNNKSNINHIHSNYENQNAFSNIKVGETTINASNTTDTFNLVAGENTSIEIENNNIIINSIDTDTIYTHPESNIEAGTYKSVTVDKYGHIIEGTNPTTLNEYGIIDAATKEQGNKADSAIQTIKVGDISYNGNTIELDAYPTTLPASDVYEWAKQESKPTYTAEEIGADVSGSANNALTSAKEYTDTEINNLNTTISSHIANKENPHNVTKTQIGLSNVEDKSSETIRGEITKENVTTALGYTPYTPNEIDNKLSALESNTDWKEAVETYDDIATTYPEPQDGWTVNVKDTDYTYRYNGTEWVTISANAIPKVTSENDGLLSKEDYINYEDANNKKHTHNNKTDLDTITSTLINNWNAAKTHADTEHARSDATNVENSSTNGNIIINGVETTIYTHPSGTNPHGTTKSDIGLDNVPNVTTNDQTPTYEDTETLTTLSSGEKLSIAFAKIKLAITNLINHIANKENPHNVIKTQVGLGNVENKSSETIRGEITKENVTTALGYTPPTSDTIYEHPTYDAKQSGLYKITVDETGHISGTTNVTKSDIVNLGIPSENTDTHYTSKNVVGSSTATSNTTTALTNGNVYLNSVENGSVTSSHKISGSGATTVTTDTSGNIVISSSNTDTKTSQTSASGNYNYPLLFSTSTSPSSGTAYGTYYDTGITVNPSTNTITATTFNGNATEAEWATNAMNDENGKPIIDYCYDILQSDDNGYLGVLYGCDTDYNYIKVYELPTASSTLGGVKTTSTVTSTIGYTACPIISGVPYYQNTTYSAATTTTAGLMSASDKSKLNAITASADSVSLSRSLTTGIATHTLTINGTATSVYAPDRTSSTIVINNSSSSYKYTGTANGFAHYSVTSTADLGATLTTICTNVSSAGSSGCKITLKEGSYTISTAFSVPAGFGVIIEGMGPNATNLEFTTYNLIKYSGAGKLTFRDMSINIEKDYYSGSSFGMFAYMSGSYDRVLNLDNVQLTATYASGNSDSMRLIYGSTSYSIVNINNSQIDIAPDSTSMAASCQALFEGITLQMSNSRLSQSGFEANGLLYYCKAYIDNCIIDLDNGYIMMSTYDETYINNCRIRCGVFAQTATTKGGALSNSFVYCYGASVESDSYLGFNIINGNRIHLASTNKMTGNSYSVISNNIVYNTTTNLIATGTYSSVIGNISRYTLAASATGASIVNNITNTSLSAMTF